MGTCDDDPSYKYPYTPIQPPRTSARSRSSTPANQQINNSVTEMIRISITIELSRLNTKRNNTVKYVYSFGITNAISSKWDLKKNKNVIYIYWIASFRQQFTSFPIALPIVITWTSSIFYLVNTAHCAILLKSNRVAQLCWRSNLIIKHPEPLKKGNWISRRECRSWWE